MAVAFVALAAWAPAPASATADVDCADFPSQAAAQRWFDDHGPGDPAYLDGDGDGVACESNPCPCAAPGSGGGDQPTTRRSATVQSVVDGDTIDVIAKGKLESVRLIGIDTPETYPDAECGGAAASRSMKRLVAPGDRVRLISDSTQDNRDRYDRLLRYVELDGADLGRRQLQRGLAQVYVYDRPFKRVGSYRRARDRAKAQRSGSWRACDGDFHRQL